MRMKGKQIVFGFNDMFNLDYSLAKVIHAGLLKYKEVISSKENEFPSTPNIYLTHVDDFAYLEEHDAEAWAKAHKRWLVDLDEIIWRFSEEGMDNYPVDFDSDAKIQRHRIRRDSAMAIFAKVFDHLWI